MERDILKEIHCSIHYYISKHGKAPDVIFVNPAMFNVLAVDVDTRCHSSGKYTCFGIEVKEYADKNSNPEWYFGTRMM